MKSTFQSGMHPDADTLTAFAEQLLTTDEREQVLAHMAVCSRCREVVFLAQQTAEEDAAMAPMVASRAVEKRSWLGGWRWAWLPVGAFVVLIGIALVLHFRRAGTETQIARNTASNETLPKASPPVAATGKPPAAPSPETAEYPEPQTMSKPRSAPKAKDALDAEENKAASRKQFELGSAQSLTMNQPGAAGGSKHGAMTARAQNSNYGGPMANQLQQNAMPEQQNLFRQNAIEDQKSLRSGQNSSATPADKGVVAGLSPASASESVSVNAATVPEPNRAPPAPAPPVQLSYIPTSERTLGLVPAAKAQLKKAMNITLPSGAPALSVASAAGRTIAIDTSGALFLSADQGGHWQPVMTQWTGRAVLVRNMQNEKSADELQAKPLPRFELVNDKLQTWMSADGKTWTAKTAPNQ